MWRAPVFCLIYFLCFFFFVIVFVWQLKHFITCDLYIFLYYTTFPHLLSRVKDFMMKFLTSSTEKQMEATVWRYVNVPSNFLFNLFYPQINLLRTIYRATYLPIKKRIINFLNNFYIYTLYFSDFTLSKD